MRERSVPAHSLHRPPRRPPRIAAGPQARIAIAAKPLVADLFLHHPDVDEIVVYDKEDAHAGAIGMFRKARELRRGGYDAALLLQNAIDAALLAFLAGIPEG